MTRLLTLLGVLALGCNGPATAPTDPTEVTLGETTFVVVVNPPVNEANDVGTPTPGPQRAAVTVIEPDSTEGGPTNGEGVVVVAPLLSGGSKTLELDGPGIDTDAATLINMYDLVDLAVAADGSDGEVMARIVHPFSRTVVRLTPDMGLDAINAELSNSDRIVLLGGGAYEGDLMFSGSRVTLFGAGPEGGEVTIDGNVIIAGSQNGIRGATITGTLEVSGSEGGISFTEVRGTTTVSGSGAVLLQNRLCGGATVSGSGTHALGNRGMAPLEGC